MGGRGISPTEGVDTEEAVNHERNIRFNVYVCFTRRQNKLCGTCRNAEETERRDHDASRKKKNPEED